MFIQVERGCPRSGPLVGELVFCPHRMQEAESSFLQDGRGRGCPKQACPLAGCLRLLPMCFGLGQGEPVRGLAPSLQGKGLAGRAWRNPRLTVSHSCFCVRLSCMYAPSTTHLEGLLGLRIPICTETHGKFLLATSSHQPTPTKGFFLHSLPPEHMGSSLSPSPLNPTLGGLPSKSRQFY